MLISTNTATAEASDRAQAAPFQEYAREHAVYDTHGFVDKVKSTVGNHFMGYAVAIQDRNGNILAAVNYGWARTQNAPDGKMAFSNHTQMGKRDQSVNGNGSDAKSSSTSEPALARRSDRGLPPPRLEKRGE